VDRADTLDSVISKFEAYSINHHSGLTNLQSTFNLDEEPIHFSLVTLSRLNGILPKYKSQEYSSSRFYRELEADNRITFIHGDQILSTLRAAYRKTSQLPANLILEFDTDVISRDNVYLGIVASTEIQKLYRLFGDALFFENIRDFLGYSEKRSGRTTPNQEIVKTIRDSPDKMLQRNNGIVIRAENVSSGISSKQLIINRGSIVNGCQTTMCLVENSETTCYVPVKVVQTDDSWDVAKAANYQSSVEVIVLIA
jgi:hypothetical protein